jgi:hypothetical protein
MARFSLAAVAVMLIVVGCQASRNQAVERELSKADALALAVSLANEECDRKYEAAPFDTSSYPIEYRDGLWHWGAVDPHGIDGYSAVVSFDGRGGSRNVEIFFSTDAPRVAPVREREDKN